MIYKLILPFLLFLAAFAQNLNAQGYQACPPGSPGAQRCTQSCINCNLDGITDQNPPLPPGPPLTVCGGAITLNSPRYYGFIAGSTDLALSITPSMCLNGQGLEFAFVENCGKYFSCFPGPNLMVGGMYFAQANGLVIGQPYQFMVDGFNGDNCQYTINVVSGSTIGPPMSPIQPITGLTQVCPNATTTYTFPPVDFAVSYTWIAPAGSKINGAGNMLILPALPASDGNNTVSIQFGNVSGNVCVVASNACSPAQSTCLFVTNTALPPVQLDDLKVCFNEIPYEWQEEPHNYLGAPGTYNLTSTPYLSYLGCDSIVKQKVILLPYNQTNLPLKYLCKDECFYIGGFEYCETGSYQEHLTTELGCDSIVNFSLYKIISEAVIVPPDTITCAVTSVSLSGAGSTMGNTVSYRWIDPDFNTISNTINATATAPGQYGLIVTNQIGGNACRDTAYVTVPSDLVKPYAEAGPDMLLTCAITQVQLQGDGSMGPDFTYFWKAQLGGNIVSGSTTLTPTVNAPGTYTLRVTNNHNGCTSVSNAVVTQNITPPVVTAAGGTKTCAAPNVTLQVSSNAPSPSYAWTGPNSFMSALQNPTVDVSGTYTVVVTNGITGCTASATAVVIAGDAVPGVTATGGTITCAQLSVTLSASSMVPGVTYQWSGPNNFMSSLQNPVVTDVGSYQVVVTAPNGCSNNASATVALNNTAPGTTLAASGSLNCNNNSVNVLATSMGIPANLTHVWTLPDSSTQNTGVVAFLAATVPGVYSVLVSNTATGCTSTASFTVVQYTNVTASIDKTENTLCSDTNDGSLSVLPMGGNGVYTYEWSNGPTTILNPDLGPGVYVVTVTDGENCTATVTGTVTAPAVIVTNATATPQTANGVADGTATANPSGGTPGYTYSWSTTDTTQSISGLLPGSYTVTVTDSNGCTKVRTVNVSQFDCTLQVDLSTVDISCFGADNGTATLDFMGGVSPFTILWSTGDTTNSVSNLTGGQYSVSITDAANCPDVQTFTIDAPTVLVANASASMTSGPGTNDGTASANPTGGIGNYSYLWSNNETTAIITDLAAATYTVTVTDENNCTAVDSVLVEAGNCNLSSDFQTTNPSCNGASNGEATIILTGGAGGFTFAWSSGGTTATETGLPAGTHTVSVTDENNCSIEVSVDLIEPPALTITLDSVQLTTCATAPEGAAYLSVGGGTGVISVDWSDGQMGPVATELVAGTYTAYVVDENGCTDSTTVEILAEDTELPVIDASNTTVPIGPNGSVILTLLNLGALVTDNCVLASVEILPGEFFCTELGDHDVTITAIDDAGNATSLTITVTIVDDADPMLVCSPSLVNCFEDNPVSYQAPTATDNCLINGGSFNITEGLPIGATFPVGTTTTTYTFTDAQGNMGSCSFEVTILSQLIVALDTVINDFNFQNIGAISVDVSGSLPPYTYEWLLNGQVVSTAQDIMGLGAGDYTLVVTDDNSCVVTSQVFTVDNTSATKTPTALDEIRIFPNPTAGNLTVLLPDDLLGTEVFMQVFDQTGRRVLEQYSIQDKDINLALHGLSDGLYSIVVRIAKEQIVRKIVLNR